LIYTNRRRLGSVGNIKIRAREIFERKDKFSELGNFEEKL